MSALSGLSNVERARASAASALTTTLDRLIPALDGEGAEARLAAAMRAAASALEHGLRPLLAMASAEMFGVAERCAERAAAALELIHAGALLHGGLALGPVGAAIDRALAPPLGDALIALAFDVLAAEDTHSDPRVRIELIALLARVGGRHGLAGAALLSAVGANPSVDAAALIRRNRLVSGESLAFACVCGAVMGHVGEPQRQALRAYAHDLSLALELAAELKGAAGGAPGRIGLVGVLGQARAKDQLAMLASQAKGHLDLFGERAEILRAVVPEGKG